MVDSFSKEHGEWGFQGFGSSKPKDLAARSFSHVSLFLSDSVLVFEAVGLRLQQLLHQMVRMMVPLTTPAKPALSEAP